MDKPQQKERAMEKKVKGWRQGDIVITEVDVLPKAAKRISHDGVLAYGEVTGHKHQIVGDGIKYFRDAPGDLYFEVQSRFVDLNHGSMPTAREQKDGHFPHRIPAGIYKVSHQREWDWRTEIIRTVED